MIKKLVFACLTLALPQGHAHAASQLSIGTLDPLENLAPLPATPGLDQYGRNLAFPPLLAVNDKWEWECILCEAIPTPVVATPPPPAPGQNVSHKKKPHETRTTWRLREGLAWSDGQAVSGYDVAMAFALWRLTAPSEKLRQLSPVTSVEVNAKNPREFTLVYRMPRFDHLSLASIALVPSHKFRTRPNDPVTADTYAQVTAYYQNLAGALAYGPYVPTDVTARHARFKRNPYFRLVGSTPFDSVELNHFNSLKEMMEALKKGQIQLTADAWQHPEAYLEKDYAQVGSAQRQQGPAVAIEQLTFNLRNPILADLSVRRAIAMAIDRALIAREAAGSETLAIQLPIAPDDPLLPPAAAIPSIPYDLKQAEELLNNAGWRLNSERLREKSGQKMEFTIATTHEAARTNTVAVIKKSMAQLGIHCEIDLANPNEFVHDVLNKARFRDMALHSWINQTPNIFWTAWHSSQIPSHLNAYQGQNIGGWFEKAVDKPLEHLEKALTVDEQKQLVTSIIKIFHEDQPALPLYIKPAFVWVDKKVGGFHMAARSFSSSAFAYQWMPSTP